MTFCGAECLLLTPSGALSVDAAKQKAPSLVRAKIDSIDLGQNPNWIVLRCTKSFRRGPMRGIISYLFTAATLTAPVPALTQPLADNNQSPGRQVAMEICSPCHRVFEGQPAPVENVPSFIAIANMPSTTALSLRVFLQSSRHMTRMPNFIMSRSDANAVIDYILSLKRQ